MRTGEFVAAGFAQGQRGITAAIEEQHRLLARRQGFFQRRAQRRRQPLRFLFDVRPIAPRERMRAIVNTSSQVDEANFRHLGNTMARHQLQVAVTALAGIDETFQRWRGAGQYHWEILDPRPHHRHVAGVIDGAVLLLESLLMLFIRDDQAKLAERQEQRRPRPDNHPRFAVHHGAIGPPAFLLRQVTVPFGGSHPEARCEAFQELHRQCDLRQQDHHLLVLFQRFGNGLEIDFGLARSGDAVQQMGRELLIRHRIAQRLGRRRLIAV